jgi:hypothetical protein
VLDPSRHVAENPYPQYVCGKGLSNFVILKCNQTTGRVNKDRHTAKSITLGQKFRLIKNEVTTVMDLVGKKNKTGSQTFLFS